MVLGKKQLLLVGLGMVCAVGLHAAPKDEDDVLLQETLEILKHGVAYSRTAAPTVVKIGLPFYVACKDLPNTRNYREHALLEAAGAVALWDLLKKGVCKATGLTSESVPCNVAAYKAGSKAKLAAQTLNGVVSVAYTGMDLVGPMVLRSVIAGNIDAMKQKNR